MRKHSAYQDGARSRRTQGLFVAGLALGAALTVAPSIASAGPVDEALAAAQQDLSEGRCASAEDRLAGISGLEDRALLLGGQCHIQQGLYPEALDRLDRVRGSSSLTSAQVGNVELYRGIALYHLERYTEAGAALDSADGLTTSDAELALYRGLLALRGGDNDRAAPALESAARLSPELTEPVASYYAGLAWQGSSERTKARDAFQRVIDLDGDGPWGKEAKKLLESTELFPFYVRGRVGIEFDDNVLLRGDVGEIDDTNPLTTAGDNDWRGVWQISSGIQLFNTGDLSGGLIATYAGNAHFDLHDVNTHYPTAGGYLAYRFGPQTVGQTRYQYGHAWVDEQPYLESHIAEASLAHTWQKAGTTVLLMDILANDLLFRPDDVADNTRTGTPPVCTLAPGAAIAIGCSPPGVNERRERKRDGIGYGAAVEHRYLLPVPSGLDEILEQIELGGGYRFRYYDSRGEEWEHFSHLFSAAVVVELPLDFSVASRVSYEHRDFEHPSTFPDVEFPGREYTLSATDRNENEVVYEGEIEKDLNENLSVSARYSYLKNSSNRDAYNYDRHIVGGYLNFRFD